MKDEHALYKAALRPMMPDFDRIRDEIRRTAPAPARRGRHRMLPVFSAACAALFLLCTAVPSVRASITDLFRGTAGDGTAEYVSTPVYDRPEIENVTVRRVEQQPWCLGVFADREAGWSAAVSDAAIEEMLWDNGELTLKYHVNAPGLPLLSADDPAICSRMERCAEGEAFPCIAGSVLIEDRNAVRSAEEAGADDAVAPPDLMHIGERSVVQTGDGSLTVTSVYQLPPEAADNELALLLWCGNAVPAGRRAADFETFGLIEIPFRIGPEQAPVKHAAPGIFRISGQDIGITEAALSPTALKIRFMTASGDFPGDLDFDIYADDVLLTADGDGDRVSYLDYLMEDTEGRTKGYLYVPFAGNGVSRITLVPYERGTGKRLGEDVIRLTFE